MLRKFRRKVVGLTFLAICFASIPTYAADRSFDELIAEREIEAYKADILKNENLYEQCESGIIPATKTNIMVCGLGDTNDVAAYQITKEVPVNADESIMAKTVVFSVPNYVITGETSDSSKGWDSAHSVEGTVTVTYEVSSYEGVRILRMKTVSGGYRIVDTSFSVKAQRVIYGQTGTGPDGLGTNETISDPKRPTTSSWSYNTGFKGFVADGGAIYSGATYWIDIERQSYSSTIQIQV